MPLRPVRNGIYFTGGATAVLLGWRDTTIDIDVKLEGDAEWLLRGIPALKEELDINVELASPEDSFQRFPRGASAASSSAVKGGSTSLS
jgi:hypothetical protein